MTAAPLSLEQLSEQHKRIHGTPLLLNCGVCFYCIRRKATRAPTASLPVLSKQSLTQQALAKTLGLDQLGIPRVGDTVRRL